MPKENAVKGIQAIAKEHAMHADADGKNVIY